MPAGNRIDSETASGRISLYRRVKCDSPMKSSRPSRSSCFDASGQTSFSMTSASYLRSTQRCSFSMPSHSRTGSSNDSHMSASPSFTSCLGATLRFLPDASVRLICRLGSVVNSDFEESSGGAGVDNHLVCCDCHDLVLFDAFIDVPCVGGDAATFPSDVI